MAITLMTLSSMGDAGAQEPKPKPPTAAVAPEKPEASTIAATAPAASAPAAKKTTGPAPTDDDGGYAAKHVERVDMTQKLAQAVYELCRGTEDDRKAVEDELVRAMPPATKSKNPRTPSDDEKKRDDAVKAANRITTKPPGEFCKNACSTGAPLASSNASTTAPATPAPSFCDFRDRTTVNAAVLVDWAAIVEVTREIKGELHKHYGSSLAQLDAQGGRAKELAASSPAGVALTSSRKIVEDLQSGGGLALAGFSVEALQVGLAGLARVIEDRARREGIGWFLSRLGKDLCDSSKGDMAHVELRTYWLPATCALANNNQDLAQYGSGTTITEALRGAITSDLNGWPGAAGGMVLGGAFLKDAQSSKAIFECTYPSEADKEICARAVQVRESGMDLVHDLLRGSSAPTALSDFASSLTFANTKPDGSAQSKKLQALACGSSIPGFTTTHRDAALAASGDGWSAGTALLSAALVSTPSCAVFVRDKQTGTRPEFHLTPKLEKVVLLVEGLSSSRALLSQRLQAVDEAWRVYKATAKQGMEASSAPLDTGLPPDLGKATDPEDIGNALRGAQDYVSARLRLAQRTQYVRQVRAALALAQASIDLADASLEAAGSVSKALLDLEAVKLRDARQLLRELSLRIQVLEKVLAEDVAGMAVSVLAYLRSPNCEVQLEPSVVDRLARYMGVLVAVASSRDPNDVARALDEAADPPGGWARKQVPSTWTVAIASFPGIASGGELREGQYGVVREKLFARAYGIPPTLVMPTGIDIASTTANGRSYAIFLSVLDPAAFLQYDPSNDGRLPGPRLTTALAPGAWLRFPLRDSPFSFNPFLVYRPGLRSWDSSVGGPAADAVQFGLSVAIDVTLFQLGSTNSEL